MFRPQPNQAACSSEVQNGQREALIGMVEKQCEHSLVVGSSTGAASSRLSLLSPLINIKMANATIKKFMTVLMNRP
jgi:hypothetical protein